MQDRKSERDRQTDRQTDTHTDRERLERAKKGGEGDLRNSLLWFFELFREIRK